MNEKMKGNRNAKFNAVDKNSNNNLTKKFANLNPKLNRCKKKFQKKMRL